MSSVDSQKGKKGDQVNLQLASVMGEVVGEELGSS